MNNGMETTLTTKKNSFLLDLASGYIAGVISILYIQPMEICKVRIQNDGGTLFKTAFSIIKNEGFFTLWRGTTIPLILGGSTAMVVFSSHKNIKERLMQYSGNKKTTILQYMIAGVNAGVLCTLVWTPSEYIKTQMQMDKRKKRVFKGSFDCIRQTTKRNGLLGLYKGFTLCALREGTNIAIHFTIFDKLRLLSGSDSLYIWSLCGAVSSFTSWLFISFFDNAKVRYQSDDLYNPLYKNLRDFVKQHSSRARERSPAAAPAGIRRPRSA